jgi:hypothetical protein
LTAAAPDLQPAAQRLNNQDWSYAVFELYLGQRDPSATLAAAPIAAALVCATCSSLSVANGCEAGPAITVFRY